jgi:hypothetical protein
MIHVSATMSKIFYCLICSTAAFLLVTQPVRAGKLDDFEKGLIEWKDGDDKEEEPQKDNFPGSCFGDFFGSCLGEFFSTMISNGSSASQERVRPDRGHDIAEGLKSREPGEALIPFFRLDANYQDVESDVYAFDWRIEGGYGPLGIQFRQTDYREENPPDNLRVRQIHGLGRLSFGNRIEIDLGLGASFIEGNNKYSGISLTIPILIYPKEFIGFEFRPSWASINEYSINDYDLGILLNRRYVSLRIGYRWVQSANESLNGLYGGLSFRL